MASKFIETAEYLMDKSFMKYKKQKCGFNEVTSVFEKSCDICCMTRISFKHFDCNRCRLQEKYKQLLLLYSIEEEKRSKEKEKDIIILKIF